MVDANGQEYITNLNLKGLQILNARAENVTALPSAAVGRYVYLSEKSGDNEIGFYYSDGTKWVLVGTAAAEAGLAKRLDGVEAAVGGGSGSGSLAEQVAQLRKDVDENTGNITANASGVTENKTTIEAVKKTADSALTKAQANETAIGADETANTVKGRIKALENSSADDSGRIDALETAVGKTDTTGLKGDVADLKTTVGGADSGLVKDVADLKTDVAKKANSADVYIKGDVDTKVGAVDTKVATNTAAITAINNAGYLKASVAADTYRTTADSYTKGEVDIKVNTAISSVYRIKGTVATASDLPTNAVKGDVYNISTAFTDDGKTYPAGTNVVYVETEGEYGAGKWDILAGVTDLSAYSTTEDVESKISTAIAAAGHASKTYVDDELAKKVPNTRTVNGHALSENVTVTKGDVGLGNVNNTADADKPVSTATQTALDKKVDKLTTKPTADTYTKVTINAEGQVTSGEQLVAGDIPSLTSAKISDFASASVAAGKKKYSVEFVAGSTWTAIGAPNDIPELPSAVTVYNADGQIVIANIKYDSTNRQLMYQVDLGGAYTVVVSL